MLWMVAKSCTSWKRLFIPLLGLQPSFWCFRISQPSTALFIISDTINYFTSCDPHHGIYTFCYWQIFWHSIWHFIWHSIWHTFWHSIWHIFWQIFWHSIWQTFWHFICHIFWHSIWHFLLASGILSGIPSGILSGISSGILSGISSVILSGRWGPAVHTELGRSPVEVQRCTLSWAGPRLRSSGAHWAGQLPGWGPAVHTELGRSQVEVQRCTLSWEVGKELGEE